MACPPAVMEQERRLFAALADVRRFEVDRGVLVLRDGEGTVRLRVARL
jgi:heat shock protein HslJ